MKLITEIPAVNDYTLNCLDPEFGFSVKCPVCGNSTFIDFVQVKLFYRV